MTHPNGGSRDPEQGKGLEETVRKMSAETEAKAEVANEGPSDEPKSFAELRAEDKTDQVFTEAAVQWLNQPDPNNPAICFFVKKRKTPFNEELMAKVITPRFQNFKRQLTLAEVKDAVKFFQEKRAKAPIEAAARARLLAEKSALRREKGDMKPAVGIPKNFLGEDGKLTICDRRSERFQAMVWNNVLIEEVPGDPVTLTAKIPNDPETNKPDRRGNFWIVNVGGGELKVVPFCEQCGKLFKAELPLNAKEYLCHGYPYDVAKAIAEAKSFEIQQARAREDRAKGYAANANLQDVPGFGEARSLKSGFRGTRDHRDQRRGR